MPGSWKRRCTVGFFCFASLALRIRPGPRCSRHAKSPRRYVSPSKRTALAERWVQTGADVVPRWL